jgi:hypothetical protein
MGDRLGLGLHCWHVRRLAGACNALVTCYTVVLSYEFTASGFSKLSKNSDCKIYTRASSVNQVPNNSPEVYTYPHQTYAQTHEVTVGAITPIFSRQILLARLDKADTVCELIHSKHQLNLFGHNSPPKRMISGQPSFLRLLG